MNLKNLYKKGTEYKQERKEWVENGIFNNH